MASLLTWPARGLFADTAARHDTTCHYLLSTIYYPLSTTGYTGLHGLRVYGCGYPGGSDYGGSRVRRTSPPGSTADQSPAYNMHIYPLLSIWIVVCVRICVYNLLWVLGSG